MVKIRRSTMNEKEWQIRMQTFAVVWQLDVIGRC